MNQDIGRAIVFSIPVVSAAVGLIMISLDITRSSNTVNRKIHYSIITVYCLIMLYWSGLVMHSVARDTFITYQPVFFSSFSFIPIFLYLITYIITGIGEQRRFPVYHFILPSCLTVTIYVIALIVPFRQRWTAIYDNEVSLTSAIVDITFIVCILLSILYSVLSLLRIKSYKRQVTDYSADIYRMSLDWLSFIIIFRVLLQTLPIAGLIGMDILGGYDIIYDYNARKLSLIDSSVQIRLQGNPIATIPYSQFASDYLPCIKINMDGKEVELGIDCGAGANLIQKSALPDDVKFETTNLTGISGNVTQQEFGNLNFTTGGVAFEEQPFVVGDISHLNLGIDGLLGYPFLSSHKMMFKNSTKELIIF